MRCAGLWRCAVWLFLAVGRCCYRVQAPRADDKWSTSQVSVIVPTIDGDEASLLSAIRTWVLNEPLEIVIVTVGTLRASAVPERQLRCLGLAASLFACASDAQPQARSMHCAPAAHAPRASRAEGARKTIQAIVDKSAGADITRVVVSPAANKRTQLVVGACVARLACVAATRGNACSGLRARAVASAVLTLRCCAPAVRARGARAQKLRPQVASAGCPCPRPGPCTAACAHSSPRAAAHPPRVDRPQLS